jgi:hypothetical protein
MLSKTVALAAYVFYHGEFVVDGAQDVAAFFIRNPFSYSA